MTRSRLFIILPGVFALLWSCQLTGKTEQPPADDWLTPRYSADTYMVTMVQPLPAVSQPTEAEKQAVDSVIRTLEFGLFAFAPDGNCQFIGANNLINSSFQLRDSRLLTQIALFDNVQQTGSGFAMTLPIPVDSSHGSVRCGLHRIEFGHDKQRVLALAKAVFTHPPAPETDEQVRVRVKNCLAFYALYFKAIYANQLQQFKPAAVGMPIRFYNGGLRLANYEENRPWKGMYANEENAKKAHRAFRKAIKSVRYYPELGNLILEYSVIFDQMSRFL
ncbi:hypothetical protein [Fibrella aquatilis]|uniref:Uncharacterized protein n=1 Tax=Fibrella aquatilis TaxID=2817059 RepID=A0A939GAL0_9BACT|nr:hypothetical protein [Fibrella aquatilis]MBO0933126.1 hypothetical protein [Fibrella aquatilis]